MMAVQVNGVTVEKVDPVTKTIVFIIGPVQVTLRWDEQKGNFVEGPRMWIDGRRSTRRPWLESEDYKEMRRSAHGIRKSRF
jgi:hypothetical protein